MNENLPADDWVLVERPLKAGTQLRALQASFEAFPRKLKPAKDAYNAAADAGVVELSRYMIDDPIWRRLSAAQKQQIVTMRELEVEARERAMD